MRAWAVLTLLLLAGVARAEEGFWPLEDFPLARANQALGTRVTAAEVKRLQEAMVQVDNCSGAFVSSHGLVVTDQACVRRCLQEQASLRRSKSLFGERCRDVALRRALPLFDTLYCSALDRAEKTDASNDGWAARTEGEELRCPDTVVEQVVGFTDVTERVKHALEGVDDKTASTAFADVERTLKKECGGDGRNYYCDLKRFADGAQFKLFRIRAFHDVRVVFDPERTVAELGRHATDYYFPRHAFTAAFVRVYQEGKPFGSPFLPLSDERPREGEPVFLAGSPGETRRSATAGQLLDIREGAELFLPVVAEARGIFSVYAREHDSPLVQTLLPTTTAQIIDGRATIESINPQLLAKRREQEEALGAKVQDKPELARIYARASKTAEEALTHDLGAHKDYFFLEQANFGSIFPTARRLVRSAAERSKPEKDRLPGYSDAELAVYDQFFGSPYPWEPGVEEAILELYFRTLRDALGAEHAVVKKILAGRTPEAAAKELVQGTHLFEPRVRVQLWRGGQAAVLASTDPAIVLLRQLEPSISRSVRVYSQEVEGPLLRSDRELNQLRFQFNGAEQYPDGNSTARLSFGRVKSYAVAGNTVAATTVLAGLFGIATGKPPFELPERWLNAKASLDLDTPLTFVADTDGMFLRMRQSDLGAVMLDSSFSVLGVVMGGNEAAGSTMFSYDAATSRTVALSSASIFHVLEQIYRADRLEQELRSPGK